MTAPEPPPDAPPGPPADGVEPGTEPVLGFLRVHGHPEYGTVINWPTMWRTVEA